MKKVRIREADQSTLRAPDKSPCKACRRRVGKQAVFIEAMRLNVDVRSPNTKLHAIYLMRHEHSREFPAIKEKDAACHENGDTRPELKSFRDSNEP
ncbi:hypothetical protein EVAR_79057_1 [Eumeta japonica]|uniref:Uncharacterized protein n=1 Tax=Eumeta variegata TaxID=151549 RepID=A0A4C1XS40_EUMVA|nr:hypothetical protein EVAR_79057_1 [Eumeta japonica]